MRRIESNKAVLNSLSIRFQSAVKGTSLDNIFAVKTYLGEDEFGHIDLREVYRLSDLPELEANEWLSSAIFNGQNYDILSLAPPEIKDKDLAEYYECHSHNLVGDNFDKYDFNWGYKGSGLKQIETLLIKAEQVWAGKESSTGHHIVDENIATLKFLSSLFQGSNDLPRVIKNCNNHIRRMNKCLESGLTNEREGQSLYMLSALEEAFRAGMNFSEFQNAEQNKLLAKQGLSFKLGRGTRLSKWKQEALEVMKDNPELDDLGVMERLVEKKVIKPATKYKKVGWKTGDGKNGFLQLKTLDSTMSKLRKNHLPSS